MAIFSRKNKARKRLKAGDPAPRFELTSSTGECFRLSDRRGKWSVLYFYPKDFTPGCTKQACMFRDYVGEIRAEGAEVYGISKDQPETHAAFAEKHRLSFPLLADVEGEVMERYGVKGLFGLAKRWTFLVDPELGISWVGENVSPSRHADEVIQVLRRQRSQMVALDKDKKGDRAC